jgi:hypothetical protein
MQLDTVARAALVGRQGGTPGVLGHRVDRRGGQRQQRQQAGERRAHGVSA